MSAIAVRDSRFLSVGLSETEWQAAVRGLGREPNEVELGIIGALWSEHCSYKSSKALLKTLPTSGPAVIQGPGENAGIVDLGDGLVCAFKIESHNHPSQIEPYQGAATGVGGILRDIFTMGARPIALLDSLRFGKYGDDATTRIFDGVVSGIAGYGNCIGIPTVGGEVYFDQSYHSNCLVNVMAVGIADRSQVTRAQARQAGDVVLLVGADTGKDGIQGANFASVELSEEGKTRKSAVQVGNPFLEKCLMEACLELAGDGRVTAIQDLGAAGLTSACAELAWRGGLGVEIDVARVPRRETDMAPYEVMLSESQERMIVVVPPQFVQEIRTVFNKWDLHSDSIGIVTEKADFVVRDDSEIVAALPLRLLIDEVPGPEMTAVPQQRGRDQVAGPGSAVDPEQALLALLGSPNIRSRRSVFRQYDHQVGNSTIQKPGGDAAVLRVAPDGRGIAVTTDGNARYGAVDPYYGGAVAVLEAAQNLVAAGATPVAITNCLNFGNPNKGEVYWQMQQTVAGMGDACRALGVPVVSGNVSLHNETACVAIDPTVVVGMVGSIDDVSTAISSEFKRQGDAIAVIGSGQTSLAGSEYQQLFGGGSEALPTLEMQSVVNTINLVMELAESGWMYSVHDCSEGGLAVAIAECCIQGSLGCNVDLADDVETLFAEGMGRFVVTLASERFADVAEVAAQSGVSCLQVGGVEGGTIRIGDIALTLDAATKVFREDL